MRDPESRDSQVPSFLSRTLQTKEIPVSETKRKKRQENSFAANNSLSYLMIVEERCV